MTTHYQGSRGPMEIATMPYPYLLNARDKLVREGDPSRAAEIEAMTARVKELDAEHTPAAPTSDDVESVLATADLEGF
jgi:hypothetical protein